jgi:hypothetical protein
MSGFKTQSKRNRELAKLNKRRAKDEKRALRKAERSASNAAAVPPVTMTPATKPAADSRPTVAPTISAGKPLTLAEAVERWKATQVVKTKRRP